MTRIYCVGKKFSEVRDDLLYHSGDHLGEITVLKKAIDSVKSKVDDIYAAMVQTGATDSDRARAAIWNVNCEDVADLILCARHLECMANIRPDDVDDAIVDNLDTYYHAVNRVDKASPVSKKCSKANKQGCASNILNSAKGKCAGYTDSKPESNANDLLAWLLLLAFLGLNNPMDFKQDGDNDTNGGAK